jgi:gliding motility-associated-like protein
MDSAGCHPHVVRFKNLSENNLGSYYWDFGNGSSSTEKNPIQIFENYTGQDKIFPVTLTSTSPIGNCVKTKTINMVVHPTPSANFRFLSDSSIQLPINTVTIGNRTQFRNNWRYYWTFDDGTTDTTGDSSFVHTFPLGNEDFLDTNFVITMVARSPMGCTDTLRKIMVVKPGQPIAAFEATPREGCRPLEVQFTSTSSFAKKFEWSYVDKEGSPAITLYDRNPVVYFETAGLKTVKLKVKGLGGQDSVEKVDYINVFETPRSSFTVDPTPPRTVIAPEQPAYFLPNDSRPEFTYAWYFGDGDSSNSRTPQHKYQTPGVYDVALKVVGPNGCSSMDTVKGAVIARGEQVLVAPSAFTPNPLGSNGGMIGGDGENDVFYPFVQGLTSIRMTIFNRWGQVLYNSDELNRGWDGYYRGKLMPSDTYIYRIQASFTNGESQTFLGDVTLLR